MTEVLRRDGVELAPELLADDGGAGEDGHVTQHLLATVAEAGSLDRQHRERAAQLVHDERREGLAIDVLGDDQHRLALLHRLLERGQQVLDGRDLLVGDEDEHILEHRLHPLGVGDQVRREVASVELHPFGVLGLEAHGLALLDGDDAVLADLVHHVGDHLADLGVSGADGRHGRDVRVGLDRSRLAREVGHDGLDALLQAALDEHRIGAGGDVLEALGHDRLTQHDGRRGAVTRHVIGLGGDLLEELRTHVLEGLLEFDLAGDGDAVVGDGRRAVLLVQHDVAALGAERHADRFSELVDAVHEGATSGLVIDELLGHGVGPSRRWSLVIGRLAPGGSGGRVGAQPSTTARMSFWLTMRRSSSSSLNSVPAYLA